MFLGRGATQFALNPTKAKLDPSGLGGRKVLSYRELIPRRCFGYGSERIIREEAVA